MTRDSVGSGAFRFNLEVLPLDEAPFRLLRDLIVLNTGVYFDDNKRAMLADKLSELVSDQGLTSFVEFYYMLRYDDNTEQHWRKVMDRLAVPETYFWRQPEQLLSISQIIAPRFYATHSNRPLRIWSAACCTGEEPISIAIALAEAGLLTASNRVEIVGTDGSEAMTERARHPSYGGRSFRQLPADLKQKYFHVAPGGTFEPDPALMRHIRYDVANLAHPTDVARFAGADVILCRNVFIYFADEAIRTVALGIAASMPPDAYL